MTKGKGVGKKTKKKDKRMDKAQKVDILIENDKLDNYQG